MIYLFDYQSECHCSKTKVTASLLRASLTTSQNATAPKLILRAIAKRVCLTTSQNATAPKHAYRPTVSVASLTTSQNATAPKRVTITERHLLV